jgi:hypothetical protein
LKLKNKPKRRDASPELSCVFEEMFLNYDDGGFIGWE